MSYPIVLQFAADHPYVSFFLSWPITFLILGASWTVATLLTNAMNAVLTVFGTIATAVMVLLRGYPPEVEKVIGDDDEGGGEGKPLAG